ncbi:hypothetical protein B0H14DRAFT_2556604 [Mycena olivaceomarginata]|nr:hypothetical protein B0H14DRAFT_2556604 [Mycena olivaceomarginata]
MSGTGVTYYDEELKHLFRLLKALPNDIPSGNAHDFIGYIPDPEEAKDFGSVQSVVSHSLEVSFGPPATMDLLADSPVQGADAIRSLADWSGGSAGSGGSAKQTAAGSTSSDGGG